MPRILLPTRESVKRRLFALWVSREHFGNESVVEVLTAGVDINDRAWSHNQAVARHFSYRDDWTASTGTCGLESR
ncbi:MAG: hypothetical protein QOD50_79 [Actinomycetota bacterium]|jgi:hypothetical protein|nr:hypothetical protein [Actinomycetota bacterium]